MYELPKPVRVLTICSSLAVFSLGGFLSVKHVTEANPIDPLIGEYAACFDSTRSKTNDQIEYYEQEWKDIPDGAYLFTSTPYSKLVEKGKIPPFSIVTERHGSLVYTPLNLQQVDLSKPFHNDYMEYAPEEAGKTLRFVDPYYILYVNDGYGELVKSYEYPEAYYEAYDAISQGDTYLKDRLLNDFIQPKGIPETPAVMPAGAVEDAAVPAAPAVPAEQENPEGK